jgi:PilZ domain
VDERRRSPRFPFYAAAQITELQTQTAITARTSELSRYGCYMDMLNPLPLGTPIKIQITYQEQTIDAKGHVIYSQPNMGMGVSFDELQAGQEVILERWVEDAKASPK